MKHTRLIAALLLISLFGSFVQAATSAQTGTFAAPVQYTDNSAIPAGAILGYDIDCQFTATGASTSIPCVFAPTTTVASPFNVSVTYPADTGGKACFRVKARTAGAVSALSPLIAGSCRDLAPLAPQAPGAVTVTITLSLNMKSDTPITVAMSEPVVTRQ